MSEATKPKFTAHISSGYCKMLKILRHDHTAKCKILSRVQGHGSARHSQLRMLLDRGDEFGMTALSPRRPPQTTARSRKPASRIFQGVSWNLSRPDFGFAKKDWVSERAFAGFGGATALALIDATMPVM